MQPTAPAPLERIVSSASQYSVASGNEGRSACVTMSLTAIDAFFRDAGPFSDAAIRAILEEGIVLYRKHQISRPDWQRNIEHESPDAAVIARFSGRIQFASVMPDALSVRATGTERDATFAEDTPSAERIAEVLSSIAARIRPGRWGALMMGSMMCMALLMHTEEPRVSLFDPHTLRGQEGCGTVVFASLLDACRYIVLEALPYSAIETLDEREITALIPGTNRLD